MFIKYIKSIALFFGIFIIMAMQPTIGFAKSAAKEYKLAIDFLRQNDYQNAYTHIKIAIEKKPKKAIYFKLGATLAGTLERYEEAIALTQKLTALNLKKKPEYHYTIRDNRLMIASLLSMLDRYDEALTYLHSAEEAHIKKFGPENFWLNEIWSKMADISLANKNHTKAIELYEKAIKILIKKNGEDHFKVSAVYQQIAKIYMRQGDFEKSLLYFEKNITTYLNFYDKPLTGFSPVDSSYLGPIWKNKNRLDRDIEFYEIYLKAQQELGDGHPKNVVLNYSLGAAFTQQGTFEKAYLHYTKALNVITENLGAEHARALKIQSELKEIAPKRAAISD